MRLSSFICLLLLFFSVSGWAQTDPANPTTPIATTGFIINQNSFNEARLSRLVGFEQAGTTLNIYGGSAGPEVDGCDPANVSSASTCNNCPSGPPCNTRRIHPGLNLDINFQIRDNPPNGQVVVMLADEAGINAVQITNTGGTAGLLTPIPSEFTGNITIPWSEICQKLGGSNQNVQGDPAQPTPTPDNTCNGPYNLSGRLLIGLDLNNATTGGPGDGSLVTTGGADIIQNQFQIILNYRGYIDDDGGTNNNVCANGAASPDGGACNFDAFPGDEKVYIQNVRVPSAFNAQSFGGIQVFYDTEDNLGGGNLPTSSSPSKALTIAPNATASSGTIALTSEIIDGLQNGTTYHFAIASLDLANNLSWFRNAGPFNSCFDSSVTDCHEATPDEVIGLLEKEFDCFIATAAYGSPLEKQVETFRKFRNQFLHPTWLGRKVIKFYYRLSPPLARFIKERPILRFIARLLLTPLWFFAFACLQAPVLLLTLLAGLLAFMAFRQRQWRPW